MPNTNPQFRQVFQSSATGPNTLTLTNSSTTTNGPDEANVNYSGIQVGIKITALTAGSLTVTIQGKDPVSDDYYTVLASAALSSTGYSTLTVYPGIAVTANVSANTILPGTYRIIAVVATGPCTATISTTLIP